MSPLGSINPLPGLTAARIDGPDAPLPAVGLAPAGGALGAPADGFGKMLDGLVGLVDAKQQASQAVTQRVLLGDSDQLHQSVIAMQEASVALSLMVEVRNKLVDSYQELMRMQA